MTADRSDRLGNGELPAGIILEVTLFPRLLRLSGESHDVSSTQVGLEADEVSYLHLNVFEYS